MHRCDLYDLPGIVVYRADAVDPGIEAMLLHFCEATRYKS